MELQDLLKLSIPVQHVAGMIAAIGSTAGGLIYLAYKMGKSSMQDLVTLSEKKEGIEKQRAVGFSEDLATIKQSLANKDLKLTELERDKLKLESDLKVLGSNRQNDIQLQNYLLQLEELKGRVAKYDELRAALLGSEEELWRLRGESPSVDTADALRNSRVRVLVVANLKGGVGKTTITANLAAHYSIKMGLRVLVIDLDYQGSLTGTVLTAAKNTLGANILADAMLGGEVNGRWLADVPRDVASILPQTRLVTCGQIFDRFENQTMMRWMIGDIQDDVRMRLVKLVLSPEVQKAYDVILIDAPPRTSLGTINALCAAHALLIPTVLDSLSVDAVGRFLRRMNGLRNLAPALSSVCVIPSLTQETSLRPDEKAALEEARQSLPNWSGTSYITKAFIRHFPTLAKVAGREIGYISDARWVRPAFDELGAEVSQRIGLRS